MTFVVSQNFCIAHCELKDSSPVFMPGTTIYASFNREIELAVAIGNMNVHKLTILLFIFTTVTF